jgi:ABC-type sugar transport system ATPase subunit
MEGPASLKVESLSYMTGTAKILHEISFQVPVGSMLVITGPSGSGKTTLLRLIAGLERPNSGTIMLGGKIVSDAATLIPPIGRGCAMVYQNLALWPHMSVRKHLEFVADKGPLSAREERIHTILDQTGLQRKSQAYPHMLSGGEQQRLAIARALMNRPKLLLMDEPFSHLDVVLKMRMISLLQEVRSCMNGAVLYVTHNLDEIRKLADSVLVITNGRSIFFNSYEAFHRQLKETLSN